MKNKKVSLSIIIISAVMLLLFGTTFAYFSISKQNDTSAINFNGHIERKGDVTLSNWSTNSFKLDFNTVDMSKLNEGYYYASNTESKPYVLSESEGTYKFAKIEVKSGEDDIDYYCTVDVNVKADGTMRTALESGDFLVTLNGGSLNTRLDLYKIKNTGKETYRVMFNLHGNDTKYIETYLRLKNKSTDQNYLKNTNMNIGIEASNLNCEIVDKKYMDITSEGKNLQTILGENTEKVKNVKIVRYLDEEINEETITPTSNIPYIYDISEKGDKSVLAWLKVNNGAEEGMYDLYIGSKNRIYTKNLNSAFYNFTNMESITIENLDTSEVTGMNGMFLGDSKLKTIDVSTFDTSNVTGINSIFSGCSSLTSLIGANRLNMSKVTGLNSMLGEVGLTEIDLSGWDLSNLTGGFGGFISGKNLTKIVMTDIKITKSNSFGGFAYNANNIETVDLSNWDASEVTNQIYFNGLYSTNNIEKEVNLKMSNWDLSNVNSLNTSFAGLPFTTMDLSGWNIENVANVNAMFASNSKLKNLNLKGWNIQNITNMSNMFSSDGMLQNLNLEGWKSQNVSNMSNMFKGCSSLAELNLDNWGVQNVTDVSEMFLGCTSLNKLSMNNWNLESLETITNMFSGNDNLEVLSMTNLTIPKITSLEGFLGGSNTQSTPNLTSVDMKNLKADTLTNTTSMFQNLGKLSVVELNGWTAPELNSTTNMFGQCGSLQQIDMSEWDVHSLADISGMLSNCLNLEAVKMDNWNVIGLTKVEHLFANDANLQEVDMSGWTIAHNIQFSYAFTRCTKLKNINMNNWDTTTLTDMSYMFAGISFSQDNVKLSAKDWNIPNVTNMRYTFVSNQFNEMDLSNWKTPKLQNLTQTFQSASKLTELNLSGWDVTKVTTMEFMFSNDSKLSDLDLNGWKAENIENISYMFYETPSLQIDINFSNWKVTKLIKARQMFQNSGIRNVDLSNWKVENYVDLEIMFYETPNLEYVNMSNWEVSKGLGTHNLFSYSAIKKVDMKNWKINNKLSLYYFLGANCSNLQVLDMSDWDTTTVTDYNQMFSYISYGSINLKLIAHNWKLNDNADLTKMFYSSDLKEIDLTGWDTSKVTNMSMMFQNNTTLKTLILNDWNTSNVTNMSSMFNSCKQLTRLDLSSFDTSKVTNMQWIFSSCSDLEYLNIKNFNFDATPDSVYDGYGGLFSVKSNAKIVVNRNAYDWLKERLIPAGLSNANVVIS